LGRYSGIGRADDADAEGGVNSVGKTEAIPDYRAILCCAEANSKVILGGGRRSANFEGANVTVRRMASESRILNDEGRIAYRIASQREN